jgi:hypothetical protein
MKIRSISLGSWFPKTSIHFYELFLFLKNQSAVAGLNPQKIKTLHKTLSPQDLKIITIDKIKCIKGASKNYEFRYFEDGLLVVNGSADDFNKGKEEIVKFYRQQLAPALSYLFSLGAKGLEVIRIPGSEKKLYLYADDINYEDLKKHFGNNEYSESVIGKLHIYTGNFLTIIEKGSQADEVIEKFINFSVFYDEVKKHANDLLQTHRFIWDDAEKLIEHNNTKSFQLITISQQLSIHIKNVGNIQSRIEQIQLNIVFRKNIWQYYKQTKSMQDLEELDYLFQYLKNIFVMTKNYLQTNTDVLTSKYNEAQQKLLNRLQFLFLVGVVVAFITLGSFPGANFTFYDISGQKIANGVMVSFNLETLMIFGIATIFITLMIIAGWVALFNKKINK